MGEGKSRRLLAYLEPRDQVEQEHTARVEKPRLLEELAWEEAEMTEETIGLMQNSQCPSQKRERGELWKPGGSEVGAKDTLERRTWDNSENQSRNSLGEYVCVCGRVVSKNIGWHREEVCKTPS